MRLEQLVSEYPKLFHMAMDGSWASIEEHGLLSTTALLDRFKINGAERRAIESERRSSCIEIKSDEGLRAVVRDNLPMSESALLKCLKGMKPSEWYELLNRHVFFWPTEDRLNRLLRAKAYRESAHTVLVIDTKALLSRYGDDMFLSAINSGSTLYNAPIRGKSTFLSVESYPYDERRRLRGHANAIAEVAVRGGIPDVREVVVSVDRRKAGVVLGKIWKP